MKYERHSKNIFASRYQIIAFFIVAMMLVLGVRLFVVTIVQHDKWSALGESQSTKEIKTSAARGNIYDRNGRLLAGSRQVFDADFSSNGMKTKEINASALSLMQLLEKNGDEVTDDFPIKFEDDGTMSWTYDEEKKAWLDERNFSQDLTASEAFEALRNEYNVDEDLTRYEAYTLLTESYGVNVPITVKTMTYVYDQEKKNFLSQWGGCFSEKECKNGVPAEKAFRRLRKYYKISGGLSDDDARKILFVRNRVAKEGSSYEPVTIADSVSDKTVAYLKEGGIDGASISTDYVRYYPNGTTAAHILGYMGSISESMLSQYEDEGYSQQDLVGQSGIEASYESQLHGQDGVKRIQVNSLGQQVSVLSETKPVKGKDVYLTIDLDLQQAAEQALSDAITKAGGQCQSGAVVAMDVETGQILAMASSPSYDPNLFADGISTEEWKSVQSSNPRDYLAPAPLFNNATMASAPPGSTFKPIVALTALRLGLDPDRYIVDHGYIDLGGLKFRTSLYNETGGTYGAENLRLGLAHSSNYYFYSIATGKDWGTGASLGYKITINDILKTAKAFGLGKKTGVEIAERVADSPSEESKIENFKISCWNYLYENAHTYFPDSIANNEKKLKKQLDTIVSWLEDDPSYAKTVKLLREKTKVKSDQVETCASHIKFDYFDQAHWRTGDQFNIGIGQGDNLYTPLQVCTYAAALGDNATYHRASLVKAVEGEGEVDTSSSEKKIDLVTEDQLNEVYEGMKAVTKIGTLAQYFSNFECDVLGKTGTAENQSVPQPASEVDYVKEHLSSLNAQAGTSVTWDQVEAEMEKLMKKDRVKYASEDDAVDKAVKELTDYKITQSMIDAGKGSYDYYSWTLTIAPADKPKVAVVTMLIQGGSSSNAAPCNKAVTEKYLELYGGSETHSSKAGTTQAVSQNGTNAAN